MNRADKALEVIDAQLRAPPVDLVTALQHAIESKRMTQAEAEECLDYYFYGSTGQQMERVEHILMAAKELLTHLYEPLE